MYLTKAVVLALAAMVVMSEDGKDPAKAEETGERGDATGTNMEQSEPGDPNMEEARPAGSSLGGSETDAIPDRADTTNMEGKTDMNNKEEYQNMGHPVSTEEKTMEKMEGASPDGEEMKEKTALGENQEAYANGQYETQKKDGMNREGYNKEEGTYPNGQYEGQNQEGMNKEGYYMEKMEGGDGGSMEMKTADGMGGIQLEVREDTYNYDPLYNCDCSMYSAEGNTKILKKVIGSHKKMVAERKQYIKEGMKLKASQKKGKILKGKPELFCRGKMYREMKGQEMKKDICITLKMLAKKIKSNWFVTDTIQDLIILDLKRDADMKEGGRMAKEYTAKMDELRVSGTKKARDAMKEFGVLATQQREYEAKRMSKQQ